MIENIFWIFWTFPNILESRGPNKQQIKIYRICHIESTFWLISKYVKFNTWYLGELSYCKATGLHRRRGGW